MIRNERTVHTHVRFIGYETQNLPLAPCQFYRTLTDKIVFETK